MPGKLLVVAGGQFGSEAKGHVAHRLCERELQNAPGVIGVRVAGPNAGHTAHSPTGQKFALRQIPVMAVVDPTVKVVIAAGSEVDFEVLEEEIATLEGHGFEIRNRLLVDAQATVLTPEHKHAETDAQMRERIGSTSKGIGECRADRIMRLAALAKDYPLQFQSWGITVCDTAQWLETRLAKGESVIVEGTQGYGLGLHAGFYPFCTSSDCRAIDFLAMVGISPWSPLVSTFEPWVVLRTYPIRVAGNSGPMYRERDWADLSEETGGYIQPERTTVTKLIRRIGDWDPGLAQAAVRANGGPPVQVAITFLDYIDPGLAFSLSKADVWRSQKAVSFLADVEDLLGVRTQLVTTGPDSAVFL